jgi:hypothetical protein
METLLITKLLPLGWAWLLTLPLAALFWEFLRAMANKAGQYTLTYLTRAWKRKK